jgi:hypothetical protein
MFKGWNQLYATHFHYTYYPSNSVFFSLNSSHFCPFGFSSPLLVPLLYLLRSVLMHWFRKSVFLISGSPILKHTQHDLILNYQSIPTVITLNSFDIVSRFSHNLAPFYLSIFVPLHTYPPLPGALLTQDDHCYPKALVMYVFHIFALILLWLIQVPFYS